MTLAVEDTPLAHIFSPPQPGRGYAQTAKCLCIEIAIHPHCHTIDFFPLVSLGVPSDHTIHTISPLQPITTRQSTLESIVCPYFIDIIYYIHIIYRYYIYMHTHPPLYTHAKFDIAAIRYIFPTHLHLYTPRNAIYRFLPPTNPRAQSPSCPPTLPSPACSRPSPPQNRVGNRQGRGKKEPLPNLVSRYPCPFPLSLNASSSSFLLAVAVSPINLHNTLPNYSQSFENLVSVVLASCLSINLSVSKSLTPFRANTRSETFRDDRLF